MEVKISLIKTDRFVVTSENYETEIYFFHTKTKYITHK